MRIGPRTLRQLRWLFMLESAASLTLLPARHGGLKCCAAQQTSTCAWCGPDAYATHWEQLLRLEYREAAEELRQRRAKWSRARLEANGLAIFDASATPETDLFGEKVVKVSKPGEARLADRFTRGDILILRPDARTPAWSDDKGFTPRECCVMECGADWLTVGVGRSWPTGLWEARRRPGTFGVRLERAAPQAPLKAQLESLQLTRTDAARGGPSTCGGSAAAACGACRLLCKS